MSTPLYSDGIYSTYSTVYHVYKVLQVANAHFAAKVVIFVKHTMITFEMFHYSGRYSIYSKVL